MGWAEGVLCELGGVMMVWIVARVDARHRLSRSSASRARDAGARGRVGHQVRLADATGASRSLHGDTPHGRSKLLLPPKEVRRHCRFLRNKRRTGPGGHLSCTSIAPAVQRLRETIVCMVGDLRQHKIHAPKDLGPDRPFVDTRMDHDDHSGRAHVSRSAVIAQPAVAD